MHTSGILLFAVGLGLLVLGAEFVIRGASRLAGSLGISPLVIGLTVVSIGTSAPELAVGVTAAWQGSGSLAVGNIAGTNVFNLLFILCLSALMRPLPIDLQVFKLDLPMMVVAACLLSGLAWDGVVSQLDGGVMVLAALLYTLALVRLSRSESRAVERAYEEEYEDAATQRTVRLTRVRDGVRLAAGLGLTVLGAHWLVEGAVDIARGLGVAEAVIGLTIVAIGTSAPELVTTIVATIRGERAVAVGNLLGSSIYNILVILAVTCLLIPGGVPVERQLLELDIPLMTAVVVVAVPVFWTGRRVSRLEGGMGLAAYLAYMYWIVAYRA